MAILLIDGKEFKYVEKNFSIHKETAIDHETGHRALLKFREIFKNNDLDFYLAFGTLLGAVRDHDIIEGDEDIDTYILEIDKNKFFTIIPILKENGFELCRVKENILYSFWYETLYIDVYFFGTYNHWLWGLWCYKYYVYAMPKKYFKETQEIDFLGTTFKCPKYPEKLLKYMYGNNWNIHLSRKKSKHRKEPLLIYFFHNKLVVLKLVFKVVIGYNYWKKVV